MFRVAAALLLAALEVSAQAIPGHYLVEMETPPLLARAASASDRQSRRGSIAAAQRAAGRHIQDLGAEVVASTDTVVNLLSVRGKNLKEAELRSVPGVRAVYRVYRRFKALDQAQSLHQIREAWEMAGGEEAAGRGMKIGIIDTGIDSTHPAFQDPNLMPPEGYPRFRRTADKTVTNSKVIVARSYDDYYGEPGETSARDLDGHGTAVAMAAAGVSLQANYARVSGIAPKAFLGAYRVFNYVDEGASDAVILQAINDAIADGMDVINLSLGSSLSDNTIDALYSRVFQLAADAGVIVVVAAGNSGPDVTTISSPAYLPEAIAVGATWNNRMFDFPVTISGTTFSGSPGDGPNAASAIGGLIFDARSVDPTGEACRPLATGSLAGRIALIDRGGCFFEYKILNAKNAGASAVLIANNTDSALITMSTGTATLPAMMIHRADAEAIRTLVREDASAPAEVGFNGRIVPLDTNQAAPFSSRGPGVNGMPKPDIAATGVALYTATLATHDRSGFVLQNGTSFSAPIVAGAAAILKAHRPGLTTAQYRSLLVSSASAVPPATGGWLLPLDVGAGILNLPRAIGGTLTAADVWLNFGTGVTGTPVTRTLTLKNLGTEADSVQIFVHIQQGVGPVPSAYTLEVPPQDSRTMEIIYPGGASPGIAQGILEARSSLTGQSLRIPYWSASPSSIPHRLDVFGTDTARPRAGAETQLLFRVIDTTGLPLVSQDMVARPLTEGTVVSGIVSFVDEAPGLAAVRVRLARGWNRLAIEIGEFREVVDLLGY